ncbi:MAG: acylphosphatase [Chloroflexales bacterium]
MERVRAHVFISGRVQGVNFRAYMRDRAREAGVEGWVCNLNDSRVEAIFEGSRPAVQKLVSWCYSGPVHAEVAKVELTWEAPTGKEGSFSILW